MSAPKKYFSLLTVASLFSIAGITQPGGAHIPKEKFVFFSKKNRFPAILYKNQGVKDLPVMPVKTTCKV